MNITVVTSSPLEVHADLAVFGVFTLPKAKPGEVPLPLRALDAALGGGLAKVLAKEDFTGKRDQSFAIPTLGKLPFDKVIIYGLGDRAKVGPVETRVFAAKAARAANGEKATTLLVALPDGFDKRLRYVAEGLELGAYRFSKYYTGERAPKSAIASATIALVGKVRAPDAKKQTDLGQQIAAAVNLSRDLSNEPPNVLHPASLAEAAREMAKANGLGVKVFDYKEILKRGMKLIDAVGRGSANEPRFVHLSYIPKKSKKRFVFVGKGITFDTGGISIKPAAGMGEMKHDMSGAANMVGLMAAVAAVKPDVEVHALLAIAENMPDGNAYRPGDVWGSLDGKTVEIVNTDAEGRLVLADALAYGRALAPDLMIDNATLTGACMVALGATCTGWYANSESAASEFAAAIKQSGETMWRMPLLDDLREQIKSDVADVKQAGDRYGGSITAALFLREFIGDTKHWIHCDIAGPANLDRPQGWMQAKGATGHAVLTFLALLERASG